MKNKAREAEQQRRQVTHQRKDAMRRARRQRVVVERKRIQAIKKQQRSADAEYARLIKAHGSYLKEPAWYKEYLKTPHWRAFKKRWRAWLSRSGRWGCAVCGNPRFEAHHRIYEHLGHEHLADVVPLCRKHHVAAHRRERDGVPLIEAHLGL